MVLVSQVWQRWQSLPAPRMGAIGSTGEKSLSAQTGAGTVVTPKHCLLCALKHHLEEHGLCQAVEEEGGSITRGGVLTGDEVLGMPAVTGLVRLCLHHSMDSGQIQSRAPVRGRHS
jgi:hypothetical protein